MKVAIISDTHDNLANLEKFLDFCKKEGVEILIHCGDVCNGETLNKMEENFFGQIYLSLGNCDLKEEILTSARKTKIFEKWGELTINGIKIAFSHKFDLQKKNPLLKHYHFLFFGHTHWPFLKKEENCILANPGNLAGLYYKATFAILETERKNLELKILEKINF